MTPALDQGIQALTARLQIAENIHLLRALEVASAAHDGQVRKYGGGPYLLHPVAVAVRLVRLGLPLDYAILGLLHDVREEDPSITHDALARGFGASMADDVASLTNLWDVIDLPRAERKARYTAQLAIASARAQTVKLADIEDNVPGIVAGAPQFAPVYLAEKRAQFQVLRAVPFDLRAATRKVLFDEGKRLEEARA